MSATRRGYRRPVRTPIRSRAAYYRAIRCALGIKAADIAKACGISPAYLSAIERGERPLPISREDTLRAAIWSADRRVYAEAARAEDSQ